MQPTEGTLKKGHLVKQIKNTTQAKWIKVCKKLDLWVPEGFGKGSHVAVYGKKGDVTTDNLIVTIPKQLYPNIQRDFVKKITAYGQKTELYTEDEVWKLLL